MVSCTIVLAEETLSTEVRVSAAAKKIAALHKHIAVQILLTTHWSDAIFG